MTADFTKKQMRWLEIWHISAQYDCMFILDYYCMNEFGHGKVASLSDDQRAYLADKAEREIFDEAIGKGYRPSGPAWGGALNDYPC